MSFGNIFKGDLFGTTALTNALNLMETPASEMERWFNWNVDYSLLPDVAIDQERGVVYVLESTADNEPLPIARTGKRGTYKIEIPRFGERETLLNRSLLGVRQTGSADTIVIEGERDKRLANIKTRVAHTKNFLMAKSLDGKIYDGAGVLLADFFVKQENGQIIIDIDLTNAKVDVNDELVILKQIADYVLGESEIAATGYKLITGYKAGQFLRTNGSVKTAMTDITNNAFLRQDNREGYIMASNVNVVDFGFRRSRGVGFIDEGTDPTVGIAFLVPEAQNFCQLVHGPSGMEEHLGIPNEFYGSRELLKHGTGVEMLGESYMIPWLMMHRAVIKVRIKGTPRANDALSALVAAEYKAREGIQAPASA